jgi:hypothetical protein
MIGWRQVFAPAEEDGALSEPVYVQKHRIRSGEQTIMVTVPREPSDAGIDPYLLLINLERFDNVGRWWIEGWRERGRRLWGRNQPSGVNNLLRPSRSVNTLARLSDICLLRRYLGRLASAAAGDPSRGCRMLNGQRPPACSASSRIHYSNPAPSQVNSSVFGV